MKVTNIILVFLVFFISCTEEQTPKIFNAETDSFVRFFMLVNNNNKVLEYPAINGGLQAVSSFEKKDVTLLKIPVTLSAKPLNNVNVDFSTLFKGDLNDGIISVLPANKQLTFTKEKLVDTIYVQQNTRITDTNKGSVIFEITNVSDPKISIGIPNEQGNNTLEITYKPTTELPYSFEINRLEIAGTKNSEVLFNVNFPNGFLPSDIVGQNILNQTSTINLSIVQNTNISNKQLQFKAILNENLPENESFDALLNLATLNGYTKGTIKTLQINKPFAGNRSNMLNIAGNFYNESVANFRLRGEYWRPDNDIPGQCEWFNTNVFTVPVVVAANHPNALQVKGAGTTTTSDDVYYHRYRIGMVSPNAGRTTNPFALKNLLVGESSDNSTGLNIIEALEFFPDNGTSETFGTVSVVSQSLIIVKSSDGTVFNVPIVGNGTYKVIDAAINLWRIDINVTFDFTEINGTVKTLPYVYHNLPQPEPALPQAINACFEPIEL